MLKMNLYYTTIEDNLTLIYSELLTNAGVRKYIRLKYIMCIRHSQWLKHPSNGSTSNIFNILLMFKQ